MEEKVNFAVVGVFVLVFSAAFIAIVLWLSSSKPYGKSYDIYQTYMLESVAGLNVNAPVRYRGVNVGQVRQIVLAPGNVEQVQVTLAIESGTPVKVDTVAKLATYGLTGIAFVELTGGSRESPQLQAVAGASYPVIRSAPSLMGRLDASLIDAAIALKNTARLTEEMPQLIHRIERSADAFDRATNELASASSNVGAKLTGETLPEVRLLIMEMREAIASFQRVSDQLEQNPSVLLYGKPAAKRGPGE
jgi:phospholipid/cholesterol/gamma-HCH transport system substrate-binding protein